MAEVPSAINALNAPTAPSPCAALIGRIRQLPLASSAGTLRQCSPNSHATQQQMGSLGSLNITTTASLPPPPLQLIPVPLTHHPLLDCRGCFWLAATFWILLLHVSHRTASLLSPRACLLVSHSLTHGFQLRDLISIRHPSSPRTSIPHPTSHTAFHIPQPPTAYSSQLTAASSHTALHSFRLTLVTGHESHPTEPLQPPHTYNGKPSQTIATSTSTRSTHNTSGPCQQRARACPQPTAHHGCDECRPAQLQADPLPGGRQLQQTQLPVAAHAGPNTSRHPARRCQCRWRDPGPRWTTKTSKGPL